MYRKVNTATIFVMLMGMLIIGCGEIIGVSDSYGSSSADRTRELSADCA